MKKSSSSKLAASLPTAQQLADYANALILVNGHGYALTNQQLPVAASPSPAYINFSKQFGPAKQQALDWSADIFASILQFPSNFVNQASGLFSMEETQISYYLSELVANPNNTTAQQGLTSSLNTLQVLVKNQAAAISNVQDQLQQFASAVQANAATLHNIAAQALAGAGSDKKAINVLLASILLLQSDIRGYQSLLTAKEMSAPVAVFTSLIGATIGSAGTDIVVNSVTGTSNSIGSTVLNSSKIQSLQARINTLQQKVSPGNQYIPELYMIAQQFAALSTAHIRARYALTEIEHTWQQLDAAVSQISAELTATGTDANSGKYAQAQAEFNLAENKWNALASFAQTLTNVTYNWQDTNGSWNTYGVQNPAIDNGNVGMIPVNSAVPA